MLRPIINEDFDQWFSLWEMYNVFYKRKISFETTQDTWNRFLNPNEPMFALVVEKDRKLIGFVHYLFHRHTARFDDACYLQDLFTLESERGQGVGQSLIDEVSMRAKEVGASHIYWMTHESNETARKIYDKIAKNTGFIVYMKAADSKE